jgi:hypothetical protein
VVFPFFRAGFFERGQKGKTTGHGNVREGQQAQGEFGKIPLKNNQHILPNGWACCPVGEG